MLEKPSKPSLRAEVSSRHPHPSSKGAELGFGDGGLAQPCRDGRGFPLLIEGGILITP